MLTQSIKKIAELNPGSARGRVYSPDGISPSIIKPLGGQAVPIFEVKGRIRSLTPRECFRLQGVSEDSINKLCNSGVSDTQLYIAAGDAVTVPVVYEIAKKIMEISHGNNQSS